MPRSTPSINKKNFRSTMNILIKREQNNGCIGSAEREKFGAKLNTKNIFKTLAFAMMMPAMLLTTACSSSDDAINNTENTETVSTKGYAIPVTVNVTRQGDDATRATYNDNGDGTGSLGFSEGDKLFVKGFHNVFGGAGAFAGTLTYVSDGTFSGTIYTQAVYSGTADELFTAATDDVEATLLPAGYEGYGFLTVSGEGYSAELATPDYTKVFATSKAVGVEQFSLEQTSQYSSGFALAPENSILNFTISGLNPETEVTVSYTDDKSNEISRSVTTDGDGTATFAIGVKDGTALHNCSLTVGGNAIALTANFKTLVFGKIYNVTRSVAPATGHVLTSAKVGDIICTDGNAYKGTDYEYLPVGVTAVAKVCYVSGGHGLALALADEASKMNRSTAISTCNGKTPTVPGCTWMLPSSDEYYDMITAAGGYVALRDGFELVGGTNLVAGDYWTRSYDEGYPCYRNFQNGHPGITNYSSVLYYVRACLSW